MVINPDNPTGAASLSWDPDALYCRPYFNYDPSLVERFLIYRLYWDENSLRFTVVDDSVEYDLYEAPFPIDEVRDLARRFKVLAVMERDIDFGLRGGIVAGDVRSAIQGHADAMVLPVVAGLGGRDVSLEEQVFVAEKALAGARSGTCDDDVLWLGLKE